MNTIKKAALISITLALPAFGITALAGVSTQTKTIPQAGDLRCDSLVDELSNQETNTALFYNATSPQVRDKLKAGIKQKSLYQAYREEIKVVFKSYLINACVDNPSMHTYTASNLALEQTSKLAETVLASYG